MVWGRGNSGGGKDGDPLGRGHASGVIIGSESGTADSCGSSGVELTARGTSTGLVLRASGAVKQEQLWSALRAFIQSRQSFVEGNQVAIEWVDQEPTVEVVEFIRARVLADFDIDLVVRGLVSRRGGDAITDEPRDISDPFFGAQNNPEDFFGETRESSSTAQRGGRVPIQTLSRQVESSVSHERSLFGGLEDAPQDVMQRTTSQRNSSLGAVSGGRSGGFMDEDEGFGSGSQNSTGPEAAIRSSATRSSGAKLGATPKVGWGAAIANWDDADARFVYGTLRSGQKIETEHSVLVFGDVNSGAEIVAGGDVVVLGSLRGVAHAGAYDETGGGRVIFALALEPTQLRIGAVISRGIVGSSSTAAATATSSSSAEIARVEGQSIVVEPYQARGAPMARGGRS